MNEDEKDKLIKEAFKKYCKSVEPQEEIWEKERKMIFKRFQKTTSLQLKAYLKRKKEIESMEVIE